MQVIDAHQHFFAASGASYPWMTGPYAALRRDFTPEHLRPLLERCGVAGTVLVQTWSSLAETESFLELAARTDFVLGVVGWVDLGAPSVGDVLDRLLAQPPGSLLAGVRHQAHDEPDARWLARPEVLRGIEAVAERGLTFDLLVRPRELPAALECVRARPGARFVIDHIAKPSIRERQLDGWREPMRELAAHANVSCKLSGLVTEADWARWRPEELRVYVETVLELFGAERCMFGSDWPVCTLAASYEVVLEALQLCLSELTPGERAHVLGATAARVYGLERDGERARGDAHS